MTHFYIPASYYAEERRRFEADLHARVILDDPRALEWTARLQAIDGRLLMVKAKDDILPGTPLRAGFYHVLRHNETAPTSVFPVHADGAYIEPNSRVIDRLFAGDLSKRDVYAQVTQADHRRDRQVEHDKELHTEQRKHHLRENVNALTRTSVSMNRDRRWTQNASGRLPDESG